VNERSASVLRFHLAHGATDMHVKILSTRHTAIGTLRRGVIYNFPEDHRDAHKAIKPMLDAKPPAAVRLTSEQVEAETAAVESLARIEEPLDTDVIDEVAELEARLQIANDDAEKQAGELRTAIGERDAATVRADKAEARATDLTGEVSAAQGRASEAEAKLGEQVTALEAAAETIATLKGELDAATAPTKDTKPKGDKSKAGDV
jgi:chromosome segregation ATPase